MKILKPIISASVACLMATAAFGANLKSNVNNYTYNNVAGINKSVTNKTAGSEKEYSLVLHANGGKISDNFMAPFFDDSTYLKRLSNRDGKFTLPTPEKTGQGFDGWCTDKALTNCSKTVTVDPDDPDMQKYVTTVVDPDSGVQRMNPKNYYAKWGTAAKTNESVIKKYDVHLYLNGGKIFAKDYMYIDVFGSYTKSFTNRDGKFTLPTPERAGATFAGWCTDKALTNCSKTVTIDPSFPDDPDMQNVAPNAVRGILYYAKYTKIKALRQQNIVNTKVKLDINK